MFMNPTELERILRELQSGDLGVNDVMERLRLLSFEDVGIARIDHHRALRQGFPEVIWGEHKSCEQLEMIIGRMANRHQNVLATRIDAGKGEVLCASFPAGDYDPVGRTFVLQTQLIKSTGRGTVLVICAGTSDLPVAREAVTTARLFGNDVEELVDVGVAGIHRILSQSEALGRASVIIVVAGMEGALPSVVGGLVAVPVIAVPTSVGYGAAFGGVAALLGMLNSCASGVTVVNIDNGFGAACAAARINREHGA